MPTKYETMLDEADPEAEDAPEDEATEPEPEPEPEADQEDEAAEAEPAPEPDEDAITPEALEKAEQRKATYVKALGKLLPERFLAHECLLCAGLGRVPFAAEPGMTFLVMDSPDGAYLHVSDPGDLASLEQDPETETCPRCKGRTEVRTGALTGGGMRRPCTLCNGNGWTYKATAPEAQAQAAGFAAAPPANGAATVGQGLHDAWGRAAGHQFWGVPPDQVPHDAVAV